MFVTNKGQIGKQFVKISIDDFLLLISVIRFGYFFVLNLLN